VLMRPGVRMGDSGTNRMVMTVASTHMTSGSPKEPVVVEVHEDRPGQDDAETDPDPENGREEADSADHPVPRELVPDDAERQREHRTPGAL
jgi:hypothetical protein